MTRPEKENIYVGFEKIIMLQYSGVLLLSNVDNISDMRLCH